MPRTVPSAFTSMFLPLLALTGAIRGEEAPALDRQEVRAAVERGLELVEKSARSYPRHRQCFSCHHQTLPLVTTVTARQRQFEIDEKLIESQTRLTLEAFRGRHERLESGTRIGGGPYTVSYGLWALDVAGHSPDDTTRAMVTFLLKTQKKDGSWPAHAGRPPMTQSPFTVSILSAYYMDRLAAPDQAGAIERATEKLKDWVLRTEPVSREDLFSRVGALALLGAPREKIREAIGAVLEAQNPDGGWGQLPGDPSDAYATGLALFTLERVRVPTHHPAFRRGARFLLDARQPNGSWRVETRATPVQTFFDNGDPHGKHQFISISATAWATTALSLLFPWREIERF